MNARIAAITAALAAPTTAAAALDTIDFLNPSDPVITITATDDLNTDTQIITVGDLTTAVFAAPDPNFAPFGSLFRTADLNATNITLGPTGNEILTISGATLELVQSEGAARITFGNNQLTGGNNGDVDVSIEFANLAPLFGGNLPNPTGEGSLTLTTFDTGNSGDVSIQPLAQPTLLQLNTANNASQTPFAGLSTGLAAPGFFATDLPTVPTTTITALPVQAIGATASFTLQQGDSAAFGFTYLAVPAPATTPIAALTALAATRRRR